MKRRNFLKLVGLGALTATVPTIAKEKKEEYGFDDIFYKPYKGNSGLVYVKNDSFLARKIYDTNGVDENFKSEYTCGTYYPVRDLLIEVKDKYVESDFDCIISYLKNRYNFQKLIPFSEPAVGKSPMRFIANKNGYMQTEFLCHWKY